MRRIPLVAGLVLSLAGAFSATAGVLPPLGTPSSASATPALPSSALTWRPCFGDAECADLTVPVDHDDPRAGTTSIAVLRVRTADPERRVGTLIVNPGGPGVAGRSYATSLAYSLPTRVTSRFDIVGFDPRGTGGSTPLRCQTQSQIAPWLRADATPDTPGETRSFVRLTRDFADACADRNGAWLDHVGTRNTARDLDLLREALAEDRLHYLGASYGTYLGALYADAFPSRVGRMVLDGAVDPKYDVIRLTESQVRGFDRALARLARSCAVDPGCRVPGTGTRGVLRTINQLLDSLDSRPLPSSSGADLTQQGAVAGILASMYDESGWAWLLDAVADARSGDGTALAALGRGFLTSDARFLAAFLGITCADSPRAPAPRDLADWADSQGDSALVPEVARYLAWSVLPCSVWPTRSDAIPKPVTAAGAAPILVVGTEHDPATPLSQARALARQLPGAALLVYAGDGHTALGRGSRCIDDAVGRYLARGTLPEPGTVCRANP